MRLIRKGFFIYIFSYLTLPTFMNAQVEGVISNCGGNAFVYSELLLMLVEVKKDLCIYSLKLQGLLILEIFLYDVFCGDGSSIGSVGGFSGNGGIIATLNAAVGPCADPVFVDPSDVGGIVTTGSLVWAFMAGNPDLPSSGALSFLCGSLPIYVVSGNYSSGIPLFKNGGSCTSCGCYRIIDVDLGNCSMEFTYDITQLTIGNGAGISGFGGNISYDASK